MCSPVAFDNKRKHVPQAAGQARACSGGMPDLAAKLFTTSLILTNLGRPAGFCDERLDGVAEREHRQHLDGLRLVPARGVELLQHLHTTAAPKQPLRTPRFTSTCTSFFRH